MLRLITQHPTIVTLHTAAVALLVVNCSATGDPVTAPPHGGASNMSSGGSSNASGGSSGSGPGSYGGYTGAGGSNSSGGSSSSSGGASKGGSSSSSGGSSSSSGGSTTTGSGGTTTSASGGTTTTGNGGSTSVNCATYSGTTAKDSTIFKDGFGTSKSGTTPWSGYAYTYTYGTGVKVDPVEKTGCFKGAQLCANGSVPAADSAGAGIGWNIAQMAGSSSAGSAALTGSVKITFAGVKAGMRVSLGPVSGDDFCYTLTSAEATAGSATIPVKSFKQACWDTATAVAYDGTTMIKSIQLMVPGSKDGGAATFDYCIVDVEPG